EARVLRREDAVRQRPDDQGEDDQQAPVESNLDPTEPTERQVAVDRSPLRTAERFRCRHLCPRLLCSCSWPRRIGKDRESLRNHRTLAPVAEVADDDDCDVLSNYVACRRRVPAVRCAVSPGRDEALVRTTIERPVQARLLLRGHAETHNLLPCAGAAATRHREPDQAARELAASGRDTAV